MAFVAVSQMQVVPRDLVESLTRWRRAYRPKERGATDAKTLTDFEMACESLAAAFDDMPYAGDETAQRDVRRLASDGGDNA